MRIAAAATTTFARRAAAMAQRRLPAPKSSGSSFQRRRAGGYPADMAVKKNYMVEEWNGKREITEKSFEVNFDTAPILIFYLMVVPYGIYTWSRSEFLSKGDRRYKELV